MNTPISDAQRALDNAGHNVARAAKNKLARTEALRQEAEALRPFVHEGWLNPAVAADRILDIARANRLPEGPEINEIVRIVGLPLGGTPRKARKGNGRDADIEQKPETSLVTRKASSYTMSAIDWFWPERFARGKLGLIGGLPDRGKGLILADICACATAKHPLPCDEGFMPQGRVLYFTAEDDIEDTLVPRLVAAAANLDKIEIVVMVMPGEQEKPRTFNLTTDLDLLRKKLEDFPDTVAVLIDPVSAYLGVGKINAHSTTDVRGFLMPLKDLAKDRSVAIIGVMHFNKKTDVHDAMLRISDSLAYTATARHVYCVIDHPDIEHLRLFMKAKNNATAPNGSGSKTLGYQTGARKVGYDKKRQKEIWAPHVIWSQSYIVDITATEAMQAAAGGKSVGKERREAETFLKNKLAMGEVMVKDIEDEAKHVHAISPRTLRRAKEKLGVLSERATGGWVWKLPSVNPNAGDS